LEYILNIETATKNCSVALAKEGKTILCKEIAEEGYSHAERLHVFIEEIIAEAGITVNDLAAIAVSQGPGSYTGLRIGVSAAKGLSYALGIPLIAVDTLKTLASQVIVSTGIIIPMIDARRMEVYCAIYDDRLDEIEPVQAKIIDEHSFEEYLQRDSIYFFGDGAAKCREKIGVNRNAVFIDDINPSASAMIPFSEAAFNAKQFEDVAYFDPYYLKDFVAGPKKVQ